MARNEAINITEEKILTGINAHQHILAARPQRLPNDQ